MRNSLISYSKHIIYVCLASCFLLATSPLFFKIAEASPLTDSHETALPKEEVTRPQNQGNLIHEKSLDLEETSVNSVPTKDLPFFERIYKRATMAWTDGNFDLYVPLYAWHNRWMYHTGEGSKFNENPWGAGIGRSYYDEDGDMHGLFAMGFKDSNKHFQPVLGYAYIKNWEIVDDLRFGLGVAAGISSRHETYYIPFPAALPLVSLEYANFSIQATYIPERYNHGNVLFTWARWHFD